MGGWELHPGHQVLRDAAEKFFPEQVAADASAAPDEVLRDVGHLGPADAMHHEWK
jgi:hypothetical protein